MAKKPIKLEVAKYKNLDGKSAVTSYVIEKDAMTIRFTDHRVFIYTNQSAGPANISKMKTLAIAGKGLGTFITANLKERFARKIR